MTLVDPFVPTRTRRALAKPRMPQRPQTTAQPAAVPKPASPAPVEAGFRQPKLQLTRPSSRPAIQPVRPDVRPAQPPQTPSATTQPIAPASIIKKTFAAPPQKASRFTSTAQLMAIALWALALGLGTYLQGVGEFAILSYAVAALALKFSSRTTFALALTAFLGVAVLQLVQPDSDMLSNFIVYAFLLLIFGAVTAGLEIRRTKRWSLRAPKRRTKLQH